MHLALLVQVHDQLKSAAISSVGTIDQIIGLKNNLEIRLDNIIQSDILKNQAPKNTQIIYPTLHVLIADQQQIYNIVQQFQPNKIYHEVYQLVQNLTLIDNY